MPALSVENKFAADASRQRTCAVKGYIRIPLRLCEQPHPPPPAIQLASIRQGIKLRLRQAVYYEFLRL